MSEISLSTSPKRLNLSIFALLAICVMLAFGLLGTLIYASRQSERIDALTGQLTQFSEAQERQQTVEMPDSGEIMAQVREDLKNYVESNVYEVLNARLDALGRNVEQLAALTQKLQTEQAAWEEKALNQIAPAAGGEPETQPSKSQKASGGEKKKTGSDLPKSMQY